MRLSFLQQFSATWVTGAEGQQRVKSKGMGRYEVSEWMRSEAKWGAGELFVLFVSPVDWDHFLPSGQGAPSHPRPTFQGPQGLIGCLIMGHTHGMFSELFIDLAKVKTNKIQVLHFIKAVRSLFFF